MRFSTQFEKKSWSNTLNFRRRWFVKNDTFPAGHPGADEPADGYYGSEAETKKDKMIMVSCYGIPANKLIIADEDVSTLPTWFYSFSFAGAFFAGGFLPWALTTLGLSIFFAPAGRAEASNGKIGPSSRVFSKICFT